MTLQTARLGDDQADNRYWADRFERVRRETERRVAPLSPEDRQIQSMPDASPAKWHCAHTTWFFEQFVLKPHDADYREFDPRFAYLFNSYYVAAGPRHARPQRGLITRPNAADVTAYRAHVDAAVGRLIGESSEPQLQVLGPILEIGLHHEQQHQELMWTDILHAFAQNPADPVCDGRWQPPPVATQPGAIEGGNAGIRAGIYSIGHAGSDFCFDNERPPHRVLLSQGSISQSLVTNGQWLEFMADGGYSTPALWLSDGWAMAEAEGWRAPGYWREIGGGWFSFTLGGLRLIDPAAPVLHVSYYEADAFARWAGQRLPSEAEWETVARAQLLGDAFGVAWQWTSSAYLPYPGYRAPPGALGEYNGKFMVNQMALRGSSLATPAGHARVTYRNFFYPQARWQFTGLRLADGP
jgi:ergothioneine biosynthesis protein EgtB